MSTLFTINFRREAYLKEVARTRRRVLVLGVWVAYFGVLGLLVGLYGLNCASLSRHLWQIERQTARVRQVRGASAEWNVHEAELALVERYVLNPRQWHDRLARLAVLLPPNVRLTSIAVNPQNLSGPAEENKLVISGLLRASAGNDRMQGVMKIVSDLHDDSLFAHSYRNVKLASTKVAPGSSGAAEFVIECR